MFCSWKLALSDGIIVFPVFVIVFGEMNMKNYFWIIFLREKHITYISKENKNKIK